MTPDPIICRHIGRSTWQGPASAAPRKEDRMTHDPEAAERLADWLASEAELMSLDYAYSPITTAPMEQGAALIRAQAAEIAAHPAALQAVRDATLREAAGYVANRSHGDDILALIDTPAPRTEPAGDALREALLWIEDYALADPSLGQIAHRAGRALAAAPAPLKEPAGGALREALTRDLNALRAAASRGPVSSREIFQMTDPMMDRLSRAAAPAPIQPAPQPDADEREAMVEIINDALYEYTERHMWEPTDSPEAIADALIAAGWTRKREEG